VLKLPRPFSFIPSAKYKALASRHRLASIKTLHVRNLYTYLSFPTFNSCQTFHRWMLRFYQFSAEKTSRHVYWIDLQLPAECTNLSFVEKQKDALVNGNQKLSHLWIIVLSADSYASNNWIMICINHQNHLNYWASSSFQIIQEFYQL